MRVVAVALASLLLAACTGSEAGGPPPEEQGPFAYRLDVSLELPQAAQGESGKERAEYTTWVAPSTGAWRSEGEDTSGFLQTHVYAGDATMSAIEGHPQSLSGSARRISWARTQASTSSSWCEAEVSSTSATKS